MLQRPDAAADPRDEALPRELPEIAPDRDLRDGKRFRKFRNLNVIARLEQPQHVLHALGLREIREDRPIVVDAQRQYDPGPRKSIAACRLSNLIDIESRFVIWSTDQADSRHGRARRALERSRALEIETPSWGYGNSGTRFHVYPWPGAARTVHERIADAALVHRLTGCCPSVALHIPWDAVDDYARAATATPRRRASRSARSTRTCSGRTSTGWAASATRTRACARRALDHCRECVEIARAGRLDDRQPLARRRHQLPGPGRPRATDSRGWSRASSSSTRSCPPGMTLLVEYKFFEPGFYSTDLPDWGTAALVCRRLGPQAQVLVDTGHHPLGTNVEQIVALLLAEGLLGGFHFNNRKYADDDLIVGSIDPFELFRIMREIARAGDAENVAFMIDQSHNVEGKIDAMVQSVMNIQTAYAKALLVDEERLAAAQARGRRARRAPHPARGVRDGRPAAPRPPPRRRSASTADPVAAFRDGGYAAARTRERGTSSVESAYGAAT